MKPVAAIYSTFLQRGYDQLIHDVCLQNLDVTFAIDRAGLVGEDGPTQHGTFDFSFLSAIPNIVVMAPKDENELGHMLKTGVEYKGPAAIRYPRGNGLGVKIEPLKSLKIGEAEILKKGKDITLLAIGSCVALSEKAASLLEKKGISVEVINARFVKPIDEKTIIASVNKTNHLLTIEENALRGGFGQTVAALLIEKGISTKVKCMGIPDAFIDHGTLSQLREYIGLTPEHISKEAQLLLE
jgi:1-deoxy-D-xylulose-5-phosphate synthase